MAKPTIVTRAGKGSALTWTEGDANVTNLRDATITVAADSGTSQVLDLNDTLTIAGGTNLSSVASATDTITINLDTTVTGLTSLTSTTVVTDAINGSSANGPITIAPDGTGDVHLNTDSVRIGDNNADATLATRGTGDLILTTNEGAGTEGIIRIYDGANGNITLTPNGTGNLVLDGLNWPQADGTANYVLKTNGSGQLSWVAQPTSVATLTTPRAIYGNNFDGSAALTQVIASTYGGTGNGFTKFSGPTTAERTFTLPDASSTILVSGGALGTPSSGTVTNLTGTASININGTVGATTKAAGTFTTLTADTTTLDDIRETVYAIGNSSTSTLTPDAANGSVQTITATGNFTLSAFSNPVSGQTITFIITQDGTGSRTLTSTMKFAGASKTLSTAASSIDILNVSYIGTTYYASLIKGYA